MRKVLIFSGTTEGRNIAMNLAKVGILCEVSVATDYGVQVMEKNKHIQILKGRKDISEIKELLEQGNYDAVIDATHPYAVLVSENIRNSLKGCKTPYYRIERRNTLEKMDNCVCVSSNEECVKALIRTTGNILLTTGSKEIRQFTEKEELRKRIYARVLPSIESISLCQEAKLEGKQIIAMQGPFTKEMNKAMLEQYNIKILVTKESGKIGGVEEKLQAAEEMKIPCYVIKRPESYQKKEHITEEQLYRELEGKWKISIWQEDKIIVTLAGIGMGSKELITVGLQEKLKCANYVFGAKRMLELISEQNEKKKLYPYYTKEKILPILEQIKKENRGRTEVVILFSGDTGFFSGCEKLYEALKNRSSEGIYVDIIPGISSISYLASRLGMGLQDAKIVSTHGVEKRIWEARLRNAVRCYEKVFLITSGVKDINHIGQLLEEKELEIVVASQLSYQDESIEILSQKEMQERKREALYVCLIQNKKIEKAVLTPHISDKAFFRDQIPMTKEEVRHLSVCKLELKEGAVVYDIGSGTGSVSVEIGNMSEQIKVYAIEANPKAVELTRKNIEKFGLKNIQLIEGCAPKVLQDLENPTHVFIGGSKGEMRGILEELIDRGTKIRVVMNFISIEAFFEMRQIMGHRKIKNYQLLQVGIQKAETVGEYHLLKANNPVFICSFDISTE